MQLAKMNKVVPSIAILTGALLMYTVNAVVPVLTRIDCRLVERRNTSPRCYEACCRDPVIKGKRTLSGKSDELPPDLKVELHVEAGIIFQVLL